MRDINYLEIKKLYKDSDKTDKDNLLILLAFWKAYDNLKATKIIEDNKFWELGFTPASCLSGLNSLLIKYADGEYVKENNTNRKSTEVKKVFQKIQTSNPLPSIKDFEPYFRCKINDNQHIIDKLLRLEPITLEELVEIRKKKIIPMNNIDLFVYYRLIRDEREKDINEYYKQAYYQTYDRWVTIFNKVCKLKKVEENIECVNDIKQLPKNHLVIDAALQYYKNIVQQKCPFLEEALEKYEGKGESGCLETDKILSTLLKSKQVILQGPPGTGKTRMAKILAFYLTHYSSPKISDKEALSRTHEILMKEYIEPEVTPVKLVQFHPGYCYEDFIIGMEIDINEKEEVIYKIKSRGIKEYTDKILIANEKEPNRKYVLIIDEINRAPLASVLGELLYALEYRTQKVSIAYDQELLIPNNLYIIGTMNTADKSVVNLDYALRRRFAYVYVDCDENVVNTKLFELINTLFAKKYVSNSVNPNDVRLGTSYYLCRGDNELVFYVIAYQILPILVEYYKDGIFKRKMKVKEFENETIQKLLENNGGLLLNQLRVKLGV